MEEEIIKVHDQFYILAEASPTEERTRVLKHGETFAIFDRYGDVRQRGLGELGLYHEGTRYVSHLELRFGPQRPLLLSSTVKESNDVLAVDLTNADVADDHTVLLPKGLIHLYRSKFLWNAACYERIQIANYGLTSVDAALSMQVDGDFADIFEVRGATRPRRGRRRPPRVVHGALVIEYEGLDGVLRRTRVRFDPPPADVEPPTARFDLRLQPREAQILAITIECETDDPAAPRVHFSVDEASAAAEAGARRHCCDVDGSNQQFDDWLNRSFADLTMMVTDTPQGPYPYAGVPWFSTPFGRDGIITALEMLWRQPDIARGVLRFLAATQADHFDAASDAEPGKILHESRKGEMAALGEIPFGRYYGSIDATPLFVMLAGAYYERTADRALAEELWPHVERALTWVDVYGDRDGDGFVEYARETPKGLVHQGWKDSQDAVCHADGTLAEAPIALCEVQGYVYAAKRHAAALAVALGRADRATALEAEAEALRLRFEERFWDERLATYVLALDRWKRPCRVRSSNAGQCLFTGIAGRERAERVAAGLLGPDSFSGWGVRTLASGELRYNPLSYHNGSVWPHDNALIAAGLARYGWRPLAARIFAGLFDASSSFDLRRMPELFCGFHRRQGQGPTLYPVACVPQAWAAAAPFLLLQACLGLNVDGVRGRITFTHPLLPPFLESVRIANLTLPGARVDLLCTRHEQNVAVQVLRRDGTPEIVVVS